MIPDATDGSVAGGSRLSGFHRSETALLVREALERNQDDADALFVLAALTAQDGKVAEGLSILDRVIGIDPAYPGAWRFKATLHRMQGQRDEEYDAWRRAEEVEP